MSVARQVVVAVALAAAVGQQARSEERATWVKPHALPPDVSLRVPLSACGGWTGFYGPIDYRSADEGVRRRVESYHFDKYWLDYQRWPPRKPLDRYLGDNFSYMLRAFPNHPATLLLMERIGRRIGSEDIPGSLFPLECWYARALQTVPEDPMVRAQYGIYLAFRGRNDEARRNLAVGDRGLCYSRTMQLEIGMAHFAIGEFRLAQLNAMRAERMGETASALKEKLVSRGAWDATIALPEDVALDCDLTEPAAPIADDGNGR